MRFATIKLAECYPWCYYCVIHHFFSSKLRTGTSQGYQGNTIYFKAQYWFLQHPRFSGIQNKRKFRRNTNGTRPEIHWVCREVWGDFLWLCIIMFSCLGIYSTLYHVLHWHCLCLQESIVNEEKQLLEKVAEMVASSNTRKKLLVGKFYKDKISHLNTWILKEKHCVVRFKLLLIVYARVQLVWPIIYKRNYQQLVFALLRTKTNGKPM